MTTTTGASPFVLGTKAQTLQKLRGRLATAEIADQVTLTVGQWRRDRPHCLATVADALAAEPLIVRSSAPAEDQEEGSCAGLYTSVPHVPDGSPHALGQAVDAVITSYTRRHGDDVDDFEVLIQPMLQGVTYAGVALTRDLVTRAPYLVVNYDDSGDTDTVTSGSGAVPKLVRIHHDTPAQALPAPLDQVAATVAELIDLLGRSALDVEWAISRGRLFVLQVRPLPGGERDHRAIDASVADEITGIRQTLRARHPARTGLYGSRTVYSTMADWNPAEMIGAHPRPLALSLYQRLITREVWREARARLGYYHPAPHQLMATFAGRPYVDLRADFNSYLPADLDPELCHKLIDCFLNRLTADPEAHDKVEFLICPSALAFDFPRHAADLAAGGLAKGEIEQLRAALARLTTAVVLDRGGQLAVMHERISQLPARRQALVASGMDRLALVDALLDDARHYGTLPFAVGVRGTFIATVLWRTLYTSGVITRDQHDRFLARIPTVATGFAADLTRTQQGQLPRQEFLARYGHLRPGTYDITVPSYAAAPDLYLAPARAQHIRPAADARGALPDQTMRRIDTALARNGLDFTAQHLLAFTREMTIRREAYKFAFTANLSIALDQITAWGRQHGLDPSCLSYLTAEDILGCAHASVTIHDSRRLRRLAQDRRRAHTAQAPVHLPDVIAREADVEVVTSRSRPNYVTDKAVTAATVVITGAQLAATSDLAGRIVFTEHADPGFEFLFSKGIAGLITRYGGAASHMAIRCTELGIPAAIGCGDAFAHLVRAVDGTGMLTLDCEQELIVPAGGTPTL
ncbi:PEP-utilizing enzyme [Nonomuraea sp. NPDC023979]|uniref:PEP-utilizing enzyme n=1 Tax=Nonomuraea sp. NPDC023979 TaxID=3154796 RepID=UPI0033EDE365